MTRKPAFLFGLFVICMCVLMLQIIETRVLSVVSYYHLAFFAISLAMFGMTAGSLLVYFKQTFFTTERLAQNLAWIASAFALSVVISALIMISTVLLNPWNGLFMSAVLWLKLIAALLPPYIFAGMGISLALTRSPWPVGQVYAADLAGAAFGCLGTLALLALIDAVSALLTVAALGAAAAWLFARAAGKQDTTTPPSLTMRWLRRPALLAAGLAVLALGNAALHPNGLVLSFTKGVMEIPFNVEVMRWNSYSRIRVERTVNDWPFMWGPSPSLPPKKIDQHYLNIDGDAGTPIYRFGGSFDDVNFLQYDITNLAYFIRSQGRAAIIGVGGGRDLISAYGFGFRDVTGIDLNPIFIDLIRNHFVDFNRLATLPGVSFQVDDARSWFASTGKDRQFDLIQMSMIDTWAATGVGAFSLSENGLYTVQGWHDFISTLAPDGVLTVSRWYSPGNVGETGRLLSLASASLMDMGVVDPSRHIFLAGVGRLATLVLGRSPLTADEIATLKATASKLGYSVLVSPDAPPFSALLRDILAAPDAATLAALSAENHIDVTAPTDERPFFFNQLRPSDAFAMLSALRTIETTPGALSGNLAATLTLVMLIVLSAVLVLVTVVIPAAPSARLVPRRLVAAGTSYFLLIGLGFMFVEIGLIQRLSLFLGHPVYGLAIGLFGLILSTGIGSLLSDRLPLRTAGVLVGWCGVTALYLGTLPLWLSQVVLANEALPITGRAAVATALIAPLGLLMGFGFPTGMRLVNGIDPRPTPWFWAINGAAGVLAAGIAVLVSIAISISACLWIGAACYLLLALAAVALRRMPVKVTA
jgi:hypothetical protein